MSIPDIVSNTPSASFLLNSQRFGEAKSLLRKTIPVARRVGGENDILTLTLRCMYAQSLYDKSGATLNDLREAVTTLEKIERTARRVLGGAHPTVLRIEACLEESRATLHVREVISK